MQRLFGALALILAMAGWSAPVSAQSAWRTMHTDTVAPTVPAAVAECHRQGQSNATCARFGQMLEAGKCNAINVPDGTMYGSMSAPGGPVGPIRKALGGPTPAYRCQVGRVTIDWYNVNDTDCNNVGVVQTSRSQAGRQCRWVTTGVIDQSTQQSYLVPLPQGCPVDCDCRPNGQGYLIVTPRPSTTIGARLVCD